MHLYYNKIHMQIIWNYFIVAAIITFFLIYMTYPKPKIILKHANDVENMQNSKNVCFNNH